MTPLFLLRFPWVSLGFRIVRHVSFKRTQNKDMKKKSQTQKKNELKKKQQNKGNEKKSSFRKPNLKTSHENKEEVGSSFPSL